MVANWAQTFEGEKLADFDMFVPLQKALTFLHSLTEPKKGRSKLFSDNAKVTLETLKCGGELLERVNENLPRFENLPPPPPKVKAPRKEYVVNGNADAMSQTTTLASLVADRPAQPTPVAENSRLDWSVISKPIGRVVDYVRNMTALDYLFLTNIVIADYGAWVLLKDMGLFFALYYSILSYQIMSMAGDRYSSQTAKRGIGLLWALEILTLCVHFGMLHLRIKQASKAGDMPFDVEQYPVVAYSLAIVLSAVFSGGAIYAVTTKRALMVEKATAVEWEKEHNETYF